MLDIFALLAISTEESRINALDQTLPDEGTQDTSAQVKLHLRHSSPLNPAGRVKSKFWRASQHARRCGISISIAWHHLKHPIDDANMEMNVFVQAVAKPGNESHGTDAQG